MPEGPIPKEPNPKGLIHFSTYQCENLHGVCSRERAGSMTGTGRLGDARLPPPVLYVAKWGRGPDSLSLGNSVSRIPVPMLLSMFSQEKISNRLSLFGKPLQRSELGTAKILNALAN